MWNEYKKPMWSDGYFRDRPWLNYFNDYERQHCCFGEGEDEGEGEGGMLGPDPTAPSWSPDTGFTGKGAAEAHASRYGNADPYSNVRDPDVAHWSVEKGLEATPEQLDEIYSSYHDPESALGFNDLVDMDFFGAVKDADAIGRSQDAQALADQARAEGKDVTISIDPDGTYNYSGPDAWSFAGTQMGKGVTDYANFMAETALPSLYAGSSFLNYGLAAANKGPLADQARAEAEREKGLSSLPAAEQAQANARATEQQRLADVENITDKSYLDAQLDKFDNKSVATDADNISFNTDSFDGGEDRIRTQSVEHTPPVVQSKKAPTARTMFANLVDNNYNKLNSPNIPAFQSWLVNNPAISNLPPWQQATQYRQAISNLTSSPSSVPSQDLPPGSGNTYSLLKSTYPHATHAQILGMLGQKHLIG